MTPTVSVGSSLRRAALLLHAMAPDDQAWMLASLPTLRRDRLEALLQDLRSLGIPADVSLLQPLAEAAAPSPAQSNEQRLHVLTGEEVDWLAGELANEPPGLAALLLAHQPWPWRAALLERLPPAQRERVTAAAAAPRLALPEAALCEALTRMLPAEKSQPSASSSLRFWRRWWRRPSHGAVPA